MESARTGFRKRGKKVIEPLNFVGLNCFPGYNFYGFRLLLWSLVRTSQVSYMEAGGKLQDVYAVGNVP